MPSERKLPSRASKISSKLELVTEDNVTTEETTHLESGEGFTTPYKSKDMMDIDTPSNAIHQSSHLSRSQRRQKSKQSPDSKQPSILSFFPAAQSPSNTSHPSTRNDNSGVTVQGTNILQREDVDLKNEDEAHIPNNASFGSALGDLKDVFADPESDIWKTCQFPLAVVILSKKEKEVADTKTSMKGSSNTTPRSAKRGSRLQREMIWCLDRAEYSTTEDSRLLRRRSRNFSTVAVSEDEPRIKEPSNEEDALMLEDEPGAGEYLKENKTPLLGDRSESKECPDDCDEVVESEEEEEEEEEEEDDDDKEVEFIPDEENEDSEESDLEAENEVDDDSVGESEEDFSDGEKPRKRIKLNSSKKADVVRPVQRRSNGLKVDSESDDLTTSTKSTRPMRDPNTDLLKFYITNEEAIELHQGGSDGEGENANEKGSYSDNYNYKDGVKRDAPPISNIEGMFQALTNKLAENKKFPGFMKNFDKGSLRIATMCSGTECPILAMQLFEHWLEREKGFILKHEHVFGAEIEPFKQAYIHRNWPSVTIFRDVVEMAASIKDSPAGGEVKLRGTTAFGGKVDVPGDIDLLVTGFCCVDFSNLNRNKKTINEGGESGDTLTAIIAQCKVLKPKIVIFENVVSAPWLDKKVMEKQEGALRKALHKILKRNPTEKEYKQFLQKKTDNKEVNRGIDYLMGQIGYETSHLILDSANYLIPQTRNRGYMVCVNRTLFDSKGELKERLEEWQRVVDFLAIPASVSAEAMLLEVQGDLRVAPELLEGLEEQKKVVRWDKCKVDHQRYRTDLRLGFHRPLTRWNENGYRIFPAFWKPMKAMTERLLDFLEIQHLRSVKRGFDDRYYSRLLDISQNVHRSQDKIPSGKIGCLTPSGIPWLTATGRRITGREALTLQGLPVNRMDLSYLTESNMQNMTGNAMSSTVVGACMMSALMLFHDRLDKRETSASPDTNRPQFEGEDKLLSSRANPSLVINPLSVGDAIDIARRSIKLCSCEEAHGFSGKSFKKCKDCNETACVEHSRSPKHNFFSYDIFGRIFPGEFEKQLKDALPLRVSFQKVAKSTFSETFKLYSRKSQEDIMLALNSEVGLKSITRSDIWEAIYESACAKLILKISPEDIRWLLYAKVSSSTHSDDQRRLKLERFPIASMIPTGKDITQGPWSYWLPQTKSVEVTVTSQGNLVESFMASRGLVDAKNTVVFDQCIVTVDPKHESDLQHNFSGSYDLRQTCAKPFNSLHVKARTVVDKKPCYMFFDHPLQCGDHSQHSYIITHDVRSLKYAEHRECIATFSPLFALPVFRKVSDTSGVDAYKHWKYLRMVPAKDKDRKDIKMDIVREGEPMEKPDRFVQTAKVVVDGRWKEFPELSFVFGAAQAVEYHSLPNTRQSCLNTSCKNSVAVLTCRAVVPKDVAILYAPKVWHQVGEDNVYQFFQNIGHLLERGRVLHNDVEGCDLWQDFPVRHIDVNCKTCAPTPPPIMWAYAEAKGNTRSRQEPYEDPEQSLGYEQLLKHRPETITAQFQFNEENEMEFNIGINPQTLVHRAVAMLTTDGNNHGLQARILLHTNSDAIPREHLKAFKLQNNKLFKPVDQPSHFAKTQLALRLEQLRTVGWAVQMEVSPKEFHEKELLEARMPSINYRLWAMATRPVLKRGGILASDIGFGKTLVALALRGYRKEADIEWSKQAEHNGCIYLKATLIVVPATLVKQWTEEATKFSEENVDILVIDTMAKLKCANVEDFKRADIVIVSLKMFEQKEYVTQVASLAGMVEHETNATARAKDAWNRSAREKIAGNINLILDKPNELDQFKTNIERQLREHVEEAQKNALPVPSKRLTGAQYLAAKAKLSKKLEKEEEQPVNSKKRPRVALAERNTSSLNFGPPKEMRKKSTKLPCDGLFGLPLEAFGFARVVCDEFQYYETDAIRTIQNLNRNATWLLCGTPPINDFSQVSKVAKFIGIRLGAEDFSSMPPDVFKKAHAEMTPTERFLMYQPPPSAHWQAARHQIAQGFLDHFLREDEALYALAPCVEHYNLTYQPPLERIMYLILEQKLASNRLEIPHNRSTHSDADIRTKKALEDYKFGEDALLWAASWFRPLLEDRPEASIEGIDIWKTVLDARKDDVNKCLTDIESLIKRAEWLQGLEVNANVRQFKTFKDQIETNNFRDAQVSRMVKGALVRAANDTKDDDWEEFYTKDSRTSDHREPYPSGKKKAYGQIMPVAEHYLRAASTALTCATTELVKRKRSVKVIESVQSLRQGFAQCDKCSTQMENQYLTFFGHCGHKICDHCLPAEIGICPEGDCSAINMEYEMVPAEQFSDHEKANNRNYGKKFEDIVALINRVRKEDKTNKFLIFAQDKQMNDELMEVLKDAHISAEKVSESSSGSSIIENFQAANTKISCLVLNIGNSSAAGCNLTMASHIIFVAPYLTRGSYAQQTYDAAMAQAIGRARRYGQKKTVNVYHMLTAYTFDVDLFEERQKRNLVASKHAPEQGILSACRKNGDKKVVDRDGELVTTIEPGHLSSHIAALVLDRQNLG